MPRRSFEGATDAQRFQLRFLDILEHSVDLLTVLRGLLYVEHAVEELLLAEDGSFANKLEDFSLGKKLHVALGLGLISADCFDAAYALKEIRNSFAFDIGRDGLTESDDLAMKGAVRGDIHARFDNCVSGDPDSAVGWRTRIAIAAVYSYLSHTLIELLVAKGRQAKVATTEPDLSKS